MPLRLFGDRSLSTAVLITFIFMGTFGSQYYFLTIHLQEVLGFNALQTGLAFLPLAVLVTAGTQLAGRLVGRLGTRGTVIIGLLLGAAGMALFAVLMSPDGSYLQLLPVIGVLSIGQGLTWTGMWVAASTGVPPPQQGVASAIASTSQQIGSAVGLAVLLAIAAPGTRDPIPDLVDGTRSATLAAAGFTILGALVALAIPTPRDRHAELEPRLEDA